MDAIFYQVIFILGILHPSLQNCPKEVLSGQTSVTWHQTPTADNIESDPQCYNNETLITRNCSNSHWTPDLDEMKPCSKVIEYYDFTSCPPGYNKITENNNDYCYQLGDPKPWDYPCFASGGASVITELSHIEVLYLLRSLKAKNISRHFWLPAHRRTPFNPVVWSTPGPNWSQIVTPNIHLTLQANLTKDCLFLDIDKSMMKTGDCSRIYPSFCFYINNLVNTVKCPAGYHSYRFKPKKAACYGIVKSDTLQGLSFYDFHNEKCNKPMSDTEDINRYIFKRIAEISELPNDLWCWFQTVHNKTLNPSKTTDLEGIINNAGILGLMNPNLPLTCMACEAEIIYGETELMFEYDIEQNLIYLTIYNPSGLWKYDVNDKGIQCFSDAKGFVKVVDINDNPYINISHFQQGLALGLIQKIVYVINLVSDSSAQYWCEGHTVNFSLIATDKMVVNPKGNEIHVFALVIKYYILLEDAENLTDLPTLIDNITNIFNAENVLLMDIFNYTSDHIHVLLHLHIAIEDIYKNVALNIQETYLTLLYIAESKLVNYNYTFIHLSSSIYCLPTSTTNTIKLDWEITLIGHISAPKQFCLQSNGLPVKRHCGGSYELGGSWGEVEGRCDITRTYEPSTKTTFLYNFVKQPNRFTSKFLSDGLIFVLDDPDIIIPADIYYLSMSLQQISDIAQDDVKSLHAIDIDHMAWVMDRVMILDCEYLRLAQTLNSTNVIVDSLSEIIEVIAKNSFNVTSKNSIISLQHAVEPQFVVQITYPDANNITGIAIVNNGTSDQFTDMLIYPLYKNTTLEDVISIKNLEIATWLPTNTLESLQMYNNSDDTIDMDNNLHIIITIYHNDAVFQELQNNTHEVNSRIIGISIPGYMCNLEYPIPILFKQFNHTMDSFCGYWDFQAQQDNHILGSWKNQGCFLVQSINNITVCECYHLTHFGQVFIHSSSFEENDNLNKVHSVALNVITLTGSFLSLFGIVGIWITALIFSNWRKKAGTKVLLQLSTAIALPLIFIVIFNLHYSMFIKEEERYTIAENMQVLCIGLGALLHFSILASFMWMLITAVLQFIRYVRVLGVRRPARFMFKFSLIGWVIPMLPVVITLVLDPYNYVPAPASIRKICYPSGKYLIVAALVPICFILIINIVLFILVLYAISRRSNKKMKSTDMDLVGAQLRVSIFLFFLLGLTWVFGIFSFSSSLIWSYLFCLTSTMQGFVLFIYFIICDPSTRGLWTTLMRPHIHLNSSRNSITSISAG